MDFECKACGVECEIIHSEDDKPEFCPFCGTLHEDEELEELEFED